MGYHPHYPVVTVINNTNIVLTPLTNRAAMNYELLALGGMCISVVMLTLGVCLMFLCVNSRTNELRDRVTYVLLCVSFVGIFFSYTVMLTLDFMECLP